MLIIYQTPPSSCHFVLYSCIALCRCSSLWLGQLGSSLPWGPGKVIFSLPASVSVKWSWSAMSPITSLGSYTWCYITEGITAISNLHTHKMHDKIEMLCRRAVFSSPPYPPFIANWHLADKLSCLHDSLNPAMIQFISLKLKKEVCKGRNICPFLHPPHWLPATTNQLKWQPQSRHSCEIHPNLPMAPDTWHLF